MLREFVWNQMYPTPAPCARAPMFVISRAVACLCLSETWLCVIAKKCSQLNKEMQFPFEHTNAYTHRHFLRYTIADKIKMHIYKLIHINTKTSTEFLWELIELLFSEHCNQCTEYRILLHSYIYWDFCCKSVS